VGKNVKDENWTEHIKHQMERGEELEQPSGKHRQKKIHAYKVAA
jgi:hypothetical protein